ncbi:MAG TPA: undecaprenyl-diphosphate phosphatase [Candidatus Fimenecus stercoravium]|nr:undecaprenyl-diphosphate phosphatase [Candidatus Fimenecus stercoravium]
MLEILKAFILGLVEGITEWLPVSSTGHMILVDEFIKLNVSDEFRSMFLVVIQLGAILAVVVMFWKKLWPFGMKEKKLLIKKPIFTMWFKVLVACIPAAIVGLLFDEQLEALFYNWQTVSVMLILVGICFIVIENYNKKRTPKINSIAEITYPIAFYIGLFQLIAAIFPGTSRSGATIVGALLLGVSRTVAAEFTFFLAVPVMFGASALKLVQYGFSYTGQEIAILLVGLVTAFVVSLFIIKFLMSYIKKHDFKVFGWYRIVLGVVVIGYFTIRALVG